MNRADLLAQTKIAPSGSFQRAMEELILSNFVVENLPFGKKKRGTTYRLVDEYSIFYHRFIKKNKKYTSGMWQQLAAGQAYKIWTGHAFELLCYKHTDTMKQRLGIAAVYAEISSLRVAATSKNEGFQVDLLIDRKDDSINFCEVKFHAEPFAIDKVYYTQLIQKKQRFLDYSKTKKQIFLTLITNHGLVHNAYARELVDAEIELEDLL